MCQSADKISSENRLKSVREITEAYTATRERTVELVRPQRILSGSLYGQDIDRVVLDREDGSITSKTGCADSESRSAG